MRAVKYTKHTQLLIRAEKRSKNMDRLTKEQAVVITGFTGILACDFSDFHAEVEARLGRPVWTHQFGDKDFAENTIKPLFEEDFLKIVHSSKK